MEQLRERIHLSGFQLKMIAVITMLIDHTAASILEGYLYRTAVFSSSQELWTKWYNFYYFLREVGRMAFPIYCFLLVEGFQYTRNRWKYAGRLAVFAVLSELPFDTALFQSWMDLEHNNVFLTLLIALVVLMVFEKIEQAAKAGGFTAQRLGWMLLAIALMLSAEFVFHTDYGAVGVATVLFMYRLRQNRMLAFGAGVLILTLCGSTMEASAFLMLIPIYFYDGSRGRKINKYVFYAFYPVHLTILAIVSAFLGIGV